MSDLVPPDRLRTYLDAHLPGWPGEIRSEKTATGQSNPTFLLTIGETRLVLRRKPPGELLKSAHAIEREYRVMAALAGHAPVPEMIHLCEDPEVIGAPFFLMSFVEGRIFDDPALPGLTPSARTAIYDAMNAGLAGLHTLDPTTLGLDDYGRPGNYFARQVSRWTRQYRASETEPIPAMETLIAWLEANMPEDDGSAALVHGDWRIDNLVFHPTEPRLIAILDWELSTLGHPLADLGAQLMQWAMPPGEEGRGLAGLDRAALGLPTDAAYIEAYANRRGLADVPDMTFPVAFAFFRMAAILQGVKKRALDGNASNPEKALKLGAYVPLFAERAIQTL